MLVDFTKKNPKAVTYGLIFVAVLAVALAIYLATHKPHPVTFESQKQAETAQGVHQAGEKAQVPLSDRQAEEAAKGIAEAKDREPDAVLQTTAQDVGKTADDYKEKVGGDFVIVTDPKNPDQVPTVNNDGKYQLKYDGPKTLLNPSQPVNLNAYVIQAYPEKLIVVGGDDASVMAGMLWKVKVPKVPLIAPHGAVGYAGVYDRYDYKHKENHIGALVAVPR